MYDNQVESQTITRQPHERITSSHTLSFDTGAAAAWRRARDQPLALDWSRREADTGHQLPVLIMNDLVSGRHSAHETLRADAGN